MKVLIKYVHARAGAFRVWFAAEKTLDLPFVPFIGLTIRLEGTAEFREACEAHYLDVAFVQWNEADGLFFCEIEDCVCEYPEISMMEEDANEMVQIGFKVRWSEEAERLREEAR